MLNKWFGRRVVPGFLLARPGPEPGRVFLWMVRTLDAPHDRRVGQVRAASEWGTAAVQLTLKHSRGRAVDPRARAAPAVAERGFAGRVE